MENDMARLLRESFEKLFGEPDYKKWVQVGKLTPEETGTHKALARETHKVEKRIEVLQAEAEHLMAGINLSRKKWWSDLHASHSLPKGNYHITSDGRVLMKPKQEESE